MTVLGYLRGQANINSPRMMEHFQRLIISIIEQALQEAFAFSINEEKQSKLIERSIGARALFGARRRQ